MSSFSIQMAFVLSFFSFSGCVTTKRLVVSRCQTISYENSVWICHYDESKRELSEKERKIFNLDTPRAKHTDAGTGYLLGAFDFSRDRFSQSIRLCADENFKRGSRENLKYSALFWVLTSGVPKENGVRELKVEPFASYVDDCIRKKIRQSVWPQSNRTDTDAVQVAVDGYWYLK